MVTKRLAVAMLAALALGAAGCFSLPLMLGSLGYEGYEYHKTGNLPGMPPSQSSSSSSSRRSRRRIRLPRLTTSNNRCRIQGAARNKNE